MWIRRALIGCAMATTLAACGSSSHAGSASSSTPASATSSSSGAAASGSNVIKVGSVSDLTGTGATFPAASQAATAYFKQLNAHGGIDGKKVDYIVLDSGGSATTAAQDARQLVEQDHVVAMVGDGSIFNCPANAAFYKQSDLMAIGLEILPQCFESSNIAPTDDGLFEGTGVSLVYAVQTLHKTKPCILYGNTPPEPALMAKVVAAAEKKTGVKLTLEEQYPGAGTTNWQSYILRASQAGCDAIVPAIAGPPLVAFEKQFTQLGMRSRITDIELSSAYDTGIGKAIAPGADGVYADSEFLPFTGSATSSPGLRSFLATMSYGHVTPSAFGEAGYVAADLFTQAVRTIKGPITAASVTHALKTAPADHSPLLGNPWTIGSGAAHQGNYSSRFVRLENGVWQPVTSSWTTLPIH